MRRLRETGADKNTLVVFTSDNGTTHDVGGVDHQFFDSVSALRGLKGQLHEGGIRVPTLFWWPGKVGASKVVAQPGYSADLMPTLCALTGADPGSPYGENLLPVVLGEKESLEPRKPMVWTGGAYGGQVAVRIGDMKAIRRQLFKGAKGGPLGWEVYDLSKDAAEKTDLASTRHDIIDAALDVLKREYKRSEPFRELAVFEH
jgi:arylsulfatase A-like enzyme